MSMPEKDYAVYKGDEFICLGKASECAKFLGIARNSIFFLSSPAYKKRIEKRSYSKNPLIVIRLEEE